MKFKKGNILNASEQIIIYENACNCFSDSGLSLALKNKYPVLATDFENFLNERKITTASLSDTNPLVTDTSLCGLLDLLDNILITEVSPFKYVIAILSKIEYFIDTGSETSPTNKKSIYHDKNAFLRGLEKVNDFAVQNNLKIAIPFNLGCKINSNEWEDVSKEIELILGDRVTVYQI